MFKKIKFKQKTEANTVNAIFPVFFFSSICNAPFFSVTKSILQDKVALMSIGFQDFSIIYRFNVEFSSNLE